MEANNDLNSTEQRTCSRCHKMQAADQFLNAGRTRLLKMCKDCREKKQGRESPLKQSSSEKENASKDLHTSTRLANGVEGPSTSAAPQLGQSSFIVAKQPVSQSAEASYDVLFLPQASASTAARGKRVQKHLAGGANPPKKDAHEALLAATEDAT